MQACKNVSKVMLRSKQAVQQLDLAIVTHPDIQNQLMHVARLTSELSAARVKISPAQIAVSHLHAEHLLLIKRFSGLLDAIVTKLNVIEASPAISSSNTSDGGGAGRNGSDRFRNSSVQEHMFSCLWILLLTSMETLNMWPQSWPARDAAEYDSTRTALHSLMTYLLRVTRCSSSMWTCMAQRMDASARFEEAHTVLSVPTAYVVNLCQMPLSKMIQEFSALPEDYFPLLSCLTLEALDTLPAAEHPSQLRTTAVTAHPHTSLPSTTQSLCALVGIVNGIAREDSTNGTGSLIHMLVSPAVIQLYKRVLVLVGQQRSHRVLLRDESTSVAVLALFLESSIGRNRHAQQFTSIDIFLAESFACGGLQPHLRPATLPVSDLQLLQALFEWMPSESDAVDRRYQLVRIVLQGWGEESDTYQPFPSPPKEEQMKGLFLALHHCCGKSLAWMTRQKQQQQQQQQQQQPHPRGVCVSGSTSPDHQVQGALELVPMILRNSTLHSELAVLEVAHEVAKLSFQPMLPTTGGTVLSLRLFHLPGSIAMLELSLRDAHCPRGANQVCDAILSTASTLLFPYRTEHSDTIPACISLAATLRKLMLALLQPPTATAQPLLKSWEVMESAVEAISIVTSRLPSLITCRQELITSLEYSKVANNCPFPAQPSPTQSVFAQGSSSHTTLIQPPARTHDIHHLESVLLVGLVQMCQHQLGLDQAATSSPARQPQWLRCMLDDLGPLSEGLIDVVGAFLPGPPNSPTPSQPMSDSVWEEYAIQHFHGRLVPGCCNLGCTNLSGVSEAGLSTQLCSGCKRARYCGVECQRAAWLQGGHRTVCRS